MKFQRRFDMRAVLVSTLSITLLASTVSGVVAPSAIVQAAPAGAATSATPAADLDRLRIEGFDAIYSLDYHAARDRFESMTKLAPDDPAGYLYLANNLWLETLNSSRRLLTSVYTSGSFYQEVSKDDRVDAKRDRTFADLIKQAITASRTRLAKDPKDARALYYHASAVGLRAAYSTSVKRSFRKAIGDANDSIKLHKQVLVLDPTYTDSYLSIGLYDYVIGSLPWHWRVLARFAGLKGSKKRGIENLEKVVGTGKFTTDDARVVLVGIYNREGQPERSLALLTELGRRYPRNYLFRIEQGAMLFNLNRQDEGNKVFAELVADQKTTSTAADVINYSWGLALFDKGDFQNALERFNAVKQWNKSDAGLVSLSILNGGKSLDAMGKRTEAVAEYQAVLKRENIFDAHKQAGEYLKKPFAPAKK
jgi:tetratricopeptide (TPR) repeat protein